MIVNPARLLPPREKTGNHPVWMFNPFIRLLAYLMLVMLSLSATSILFTWIFPDALVSNRLAGQLLLNLAYTAMLTALYYFLIRKIEQRPVYELSGAVWFTELFAGIIIGTVLIGMVILIFAFAGFYSIELLNQTIIF